MKSVIVGAGAALVDLVMEADDAFLQTLHSPKGGMTLVDWPRMQLILANMPENASRVPGGSACNTIVGLAKLGAKSRMIGRVGDDDFGRVFEHGLEHAGVEKCLSKSQTPTGRVLSVVTPDAQRTMFTYLGASSEFSPNDLLPEYFKNAELVVVEGYLLFNPPVVHRLVELAKSVGAKVALDLASFQVVEVCRPLIEELLAGSIDILIANEDEALAYCKESEEKALEAMALKANMAVVKLGGRGALLAFGKERLHSTAHVVKAIDTTGAGDLWAAGLFYGLSEKMSLEQSAKLAAKVGSEVVQVRGAVIPDDAWERIHAFKKELLAI